MMVATNDASRKPGHSLTDDHSNGRSAPANVTTVLTAGAYRGGFLGFQETPFESKMIFKTTCLNIKLPIKLSSYRMQIIV